MSIALVTGGAGFIGSHLVDLLLAEGFKVRIIDNFSGGSIKNLENNINNANLEVLDLDILELTSDNNIFKGVNHVYHLAGIGDIVPSIEKPTNYFATNVLGTVKVLEASRNYSVKKFVYAASSSCYGLAKTPTDEKNEISPMYPYAMSKYLGEQATFHWNSVYGLPVVSICIFNAFGPRVKTRGAYGAVFGVFLKQHLESHPLTIVGDGQQKRDFVFVSDVARAFLLAALNSVSGERFNIGGGNPITINYLAELIGGEKIYIPKRPGEPDITFANIEKAHKFLGWKPLIAFEKGVKEMLDSLSSWKDAPLWTPESIANATKLWMEFMSHNEN